MFNLDKFAALFGERGDERRDLTFMARVAEGAERYDDMCKFMRELVLHCIKSNSELTVEERNLLSVAYKNVIGTRRASWRHLNSDEHVNNQDLIDTYKRQVEKELEDTCNDVLDLLKKLDDNTKVESDSGEPKVFYLKMCGDYYRYLAESCSDQGHDKAADKYYREAYKIAKEHLKATHPIRLGLALNYSVCFYEILKDKNKACELAKEAFDDAISKLDKLEEADYKDSTLIMQLLRDNLTLWTSQDNGDGEQVQVEDLSDEEN